MGVLSVTDDNKGLTALLVNTYAGQPAGEVSQSSSQLSFVDRAAAAVQDLVPICQQLARLSAKSQQLLGADQAQQAQVRHGSVRHGSQVRQRRSSQLQQRRRLLPQPAAAVLSCQPHKLLCSHFLEAHLLPLTLSRMLPPPLRTHPISAADHRISLEWLTWVVSELALVTDEKLQHVNDHLATRTFLAGTTCASLADLVVFGTVHPAVVSQHTSVCGGRTGGGGVWEGGGRTGGRRVGVGGLGGGWLVGWLVGRWVGGWGWAGGKPVPAWQIWWFLALCTRQW